MLGLQWRAAVLSYTFTPLPQCLNPGQRGGEMDKRGFLGVILPGMAVAQNPIAEQSGLSQEEVKNNALDDFRYFVGFVAGRLSVELHDGWLHPLVTRTGDRRSGD